MTGFLQRLAERAMGVSRPAHAAGASPFAPMPEPVGEEMAVAMRSSPENALASAPPPGRSDTVTATGMRIETPTSATQTVPKPGMPLVAQPTAPKQISAAQPIAPMQSSMQSPPTGLRAASTRETVPEAEATLSGAPAILLPAEVSQTRMSNTLTNRPHPVPVALQPLLPLAPEAPPTFRAGDRGAGAIAVQRQNPVDESTEVHVHIGRIEVTAVHEPAPAKPATARRPAPMSLDEYLVKRYGRPA